MRNIVMRLIVVVCYCGVLVAAKPMVALNRYNVILVHGAAPEEKGGGDTNKVLDKNGDVSKESTL